MGEEGEKIFLSGKSLLASKRLYRQHLCLKGQEISLIRGLFFMGPLSSKEEGEGVRKRPLAEGL